MITDKYTIKEIANYYGTLEIWKENGKYWWYIDDYTGYEPTEISEKLFNTLVSELKLDDKHS